MSAIHYLSLCSGIEAATMAWHTFGWEPVAFAEIEPFPAATLAHHYPDVPNLGDMTRWREWPESLLETVDVLVGGTPCQAFSVAGLRNSLADARGNLTLIYAQIFQAIDDARARAGRPPAVCLWENVPGVLNTEDNAFGCFLAALAGEDVPIQPPGGRWTDAGYVRGPGRAACWRLLDAQYFGLAQRRRRVFLVAGAGEGFRPEQVLFEFDRVRRDSPPSREAGQTVTPTIRAGAPNGGPGHGARSGDSKDELIVAVADNLIPEVAGSLDTECGGGKLTHQIIQSGHIIGTITARMFNSLGARDVEEGALLPVTTNTLRGEGFDASEDGTGRETPLVPVAAFNNTGQGWWSEAESAATVRKGDDNGNGGARESTIVCVHGTQDPCHDENTAFALGRNHGQENAIAFEPRMVRTTGGQPQEELTHCLRSDANSGDGAPCVAFTTEQTPKFNHDQALTLTKQSPTGGGQPQCVGTSTAVRRLTPRECERLQGFPDDFTAIPWRRKPAADCPDGPRYKALGNSMAVPCMRWIGLRLDACLNSPKPPTTPQPNE